MHVACLCICKNVLTEVRLVARVKRRLSLNIHVEWRTMAVFPSAHRDLEFHSRYNSHEFGNIRNAWYIPLTHLANRVVMDSVRSYTSESCTRQMSYIHNMKRNQPQTRGYLWDSWSHTQIHVYICTRTHIHTQTRQECRNNLTETVHASWLITSCSSNHERTSEWFRASTTVVVKLPHLFQRNGLGSIKSGESDVSL